MPVSRSERESSYQPFQCTICSKRFTRHENLKRHGAIHSQSANDVALKCDFCPSTFTRLDLKKRHYRNKHPNEVVPPAEPLSELQPHTKQKLPSIGTPKKHLQNDIQQWGVHMPDAFRNDFHLPGPSTLGGSSHLNGLLSDIPTSMTNWNDVLGLPSPFLYPQPLTSTSSAAQLLPLAQPLNSTTTHQHQHRNSSSTCSKCSSSPSSSHHNDWVPSRQQIVVGIQLFFHHISHFVPFLHQPTISPEVTPIHLLLSMISLGYQYGEDPDEDNTMTDNNSYLTSGQKLSLKCFATAKETTAQMEDDSADSVHKLIIVQSYLLLEVYAMMYLESVEGGSDGLKIHSKIISLSRSSGLMQPLPTKPSATSDLDSLWKEFIKAESHKRTMLFLHHIDSLWYQLLSVPRSISHLEIKHDMPFPNSVFHLSSSAQWAHRTLIANNTSTPPIRYAETIKLFLSSPANPTSPRQKLPSKGVVELQGALNVIHFIQASLREVSGWLSMTGLTSSDRFDALQLSLKAIEPYSRVKNRTSATTSPWLMVEATWEMAMLETLLWSASHMGGIVEVTLDAALATASCLTTSDAFILDEEIANQLQVHVDWFLHYLEDTTQPDQEPPFVTVYAFRAFLVALQLLRGVSPNSMSVVGIKEGDTEGAFEWAEKVFKRRSRWKVGSLVERNLTSLSESLRAS